MAEITIKVGNSKVKTSSEELIDVNETADGVVFALKGGLSILFTDPYMAGSTKQIIKNTADKKGAGKEIIFELDNPKCPAMIKS